LYKEITTMATEYDDQEVRQGGTPRWVTGSVVALALVSLLALGIGWSAVNRSRESQEAAANDAKALHANLDAMNSRLAQAEAANAQAQGDLNSVSGKLQVAQSELDKSRKQTSQIRTDYSKQMNAMQQQVKTDEDALATKASSDDVKAVSSDVNGIKSDLDSTNQNLENAKGELGTQIAHNHDELEQLRRLGQRDYFEFTLSGKDAKTRVGDVTLQLHATNPKRHQFTVELLADDARFEKKNRSVNEPIFFYTRGSRQSLELVVNQVGKDKIVGYLSAPKAPIDTTTAASSAGAGTN
jgi:septal ring factor EnvC (AmiA/AmiB activator)